MQNDQINGCGIIDSIESVIARYKAKRIFLVTGKSSYENLKRIDKFKKIIAKYKTLRFCDFDANPKLDHVLKGIKIFKAFSPDVIISIGGGSVIDMGKLINILSSQKIRDYKSIVIDNFIKDKGLPFIAIPTTAGTGSESTHFAVIYIQDKKYSLAHEFILPDVAIVDPQLTFNAPKYLAASSGMDALCQAIESYWSNGSNKQSLNYAKKAILTILDSFVPAIADRNHNAMIAMANAANLAGKAINISKTTAPHSLSYGITSNFMIPHGHAVALTLGEFFIINSDHKNKFLNKNISFQSHLERMEKLYQFFGVTSAIECRKKWYALMDNITLEYSFEKLGITDNNKIESIIDNINIERLNNNPVAVSKELLKDIFYKKM